MSCDEEFGLFLTANPTYVAYGDLPNDDNNDNQVFRCSDNGIRRYYRPTITPDCDIALAQFLIDNPQFVETTLNGEPEQNRRTRIFICPGSGLLRYYGFTRAGNFQRLLDYLVIDTQSDGLTREGIVFLESETPPDFTVEEFYTFLATQEAFVGRFFAADGSYEVYLRKGGRYQRDFPQFIISV